MSRCFGIIIAGLEVSGANPAALAILAVIFIIARILHGLGMDGGKRQRLRMFGMMGSSLVTLALTFWAIISVIGSLLRR